MKCPDIETLIRFAREPETDDIDIAVHIYMCQHCQHIVNELVEYVFDDSVPTEDDLTAFLREKKQQNAGGQWPKLRNLIHKLTHQNNASDDSLLQSLLQSFLPDGTATIMAPAASGKVMAIPVFYEGETFEIAFEASGPKDSPRYWYATFDIASGVKDDSRLIVYVTNYRGEKITNARLVILGNSLPVRYGITEITFSQIIKNLQNTEVCLYGMDGESTPGTLVIC